MNRYLHNKILVRALNFIEAHNGNFPIEKLHELIDTTLNENNQTINDDEKYDLFLGLIEDLKYYF